MGTEPVVFKASDDVGRAGSRWNDAASVLVSEAKDDPLLPCVLVDEPLERSTGRSPRSFARLKHIRCLLIENS